MEEMHFLLHIPPLCDGADIQPGSAQRVHSYRDIGTDASMIQHVIVRGRLRHTVLRAGTVR